MLSNGFVGNLYNLFLQQLVSTGRGLQASWYESFMLLKQACVALSNVGLVPATHNKFV